MTVAACAAIAHRAVGGAHADALAGLLGGLVSSTQVTLVHARVLRAQVRQPGHGDALVKLFEVGRGNDVADHLDI